MRKEYPYLKDKDFLKIVDSLKIKEQFVKITLLNWDEEPLTEIQGKVTSGNLNLDGNSAMRRTCNLSTFIPEEEIDFNNLNTEFSLNKKIFLEVGFTNTTEYYQEEQYIWFPLGIYVIINVSTSHNLSGSNMNLQLKDKMCLLNGEIAGILPAAVTFSEIEDIDEQGNSTIYKPTMYQIIQECVNHFGGEQLSKIIINGLDTRVKQVMKWTGSDPLYIKENGKTYEVSLNYDGTSEQKAYSVGMDIGFIYTDFVYPGELIGNAGDTITSILDNIKNTLGNFEYFYDVFGNFIFQEIRNYLNTTQPKVDLNNIYKENYEVDLSRGKASYVFNSNNLITSFTNAPQYLMIKNDFIVWGERTGITGIKYPIRYHLAIDEKPKVGNTYEVVLYEDEYGIKRARPPKQGEVGQTITTKDWRSELYLSGVVSDKLATNNNLYYTELNGEWQKLYDLEKGEFLQEAVDAPYNLDYFLDFINASDSPLGKFSIKNIGSRQKVIVDSKINCVFEPDIPDIVFIKINGGEEQEALRQECETTGQQYIQVSSQIYDLITLGGTHNSAYNAIKDLLYQYTQYNESITIQCLPLFYIEPNTIINVTDTKSGIYGDYVINSISIPLNIGATMNINATRARQKI